MPKKQLVLDLGGGAGVIRLHITGPGYDIKAHQAVATLLDNKMGINPGDIITSQDKHGVVATLFFDDAEVRKLLEVVKEGGYEVLPDEQYVLKRLSNLSGSKEPNLR